MLVITMLALRACASQAPKTLDQKLQGVHTEERKELLRLTSLNEAEWPTCHSPAYKQGNVGIRRRPEHSDNPQVSGMKALRRKMDALADAGAKKKPPPGKLAHMCAEKVAAKTHKSRRGGADHAQRIEKICGEMIGQKIGEIRHVRSRQHT